MQSGIPVATMVIDGARTAALYAVSILALQDQGLRDRLEAFRVRQSEKVLHTQL
jgi:5-(carboxyamino)imidazole ribonucleotide mutase